ncbi:SHOCT domain-containing protein [Streptacidiphilus sp. MAP5-3]|uniref:SHOCT domain-containing protein n=1 Tax=unclassified Streptacidiphilus TaxID=2643834 RepID=UPI003514F1C4
MARRQGEQAAAQQAAQSPAPVPADVPSPPVQARPGLTEADISSLERLARLHEQGVLSDEELSAAKARVLGI